MEFNVTVIIALSALVLLCVCLVFNGYPAAEIGALFFASLLSPESGLLEEWPLHLPKIDALDLRQDSEFERFLAARRLRKREEIGRASAPETGTLEPFPPGWYAAC